MFLIEFLNKIRLVSAKALTNTTQDEQELDRVLVEAKVGRLRIQNGADQVTFGCEKPCGAEIKRRIRLT